jgi:predicted metal-dependent hydrolase
MNPHAAQAPAIVPREKLDFGLEGDIPTYWFGGDVFKTRYFDAMSTIFPEGERYFISCVRDFRDRITDPQLLADVKDFMRQEGQHGIVHSQYNDRLRRQGIDVDKLEAFQRNMMFNVARKYLPAEVTLADTAAAEHLTATMAQALCENPEVLAQADPRMRAMYAWHAMEEMEHKAVAFDVLQKVAKVGYLRRAFGLLLVTFGFNLNVLLTTRYMLKVDGFGPWQRTKMFARGLWWLFGVGGLYTRMIPSYLRYYKPGFHPWETGVIQSYQVWLDTFNRTGDPLKAGEALQAPRAA